MIGLTSARNAAFVDGTGYYDRVVDYDAVASLPAAPTVFVDFAGNGAVLERVHRHFGDQLRHSAQVGVTHWERMAAPADLPGPAPVFFFAPDPAAQAPAGMGSGPVPAPPRRGDAALPHLEPPGCGSSSTAAPPPSSGSTAPWSTAPSTRPRATCCRCSRGPRGRTATRQRRPEGRRLESCCRAAPPGGAAHRRAATRAAATAARRGRRRRPGRWGGGRRRRRR